MPTRWTRYLMLTLAVTLAVSATTTVVTAAPSAAASTTTITLVTHDSFAVSKRVLRGFEDRTGIHVKVLQAGDAGAALNQVILTKSNPIGDVFFGVDNTFLSRALRGRRVRRVPLARRSRPCRRHTSSIRRTTSRPSTTVTCASTTTSSGSRSRSCRCPTPSPI